MSVAIQLSDQRFARVSPAVKTMKSATRARRLADQRPQWRGRSKRLASAESELSDWHV